LACPVRAWNRAFSAANLDAKALRLMSSIFTQSIAKFGTLFRSVRSVILIHAGDQNSSRVISGDC
jgi:hypothetical protein